MEVLLPQRPCQVAFEAQYWSCSPARVFPARALVLSPPASCGGSFSRPPPSPLVFARCHANCPAECAIEAGVRGELAAKGNIAHLTKIFAELIEALAHDKVS